MEIWQLAASQIKEPTISCLAFSCFIHDLMTGNMSLFSCCRQSDKSIKMYVFWDRYAFSLIRRVIANFMQCFSHVTFVAASVAQIKFYLQKLYVSISVGLVVEVWISAFVFVNLMYLKPVLWEYKINVILDLCSLSLFEFVKQFPHTVYMQFIYFFWVTSLVWLWT